MLELNEAGYYNFEYPYNSLTSFVGRKIIRPSSDSFYEQLNLVHSNLESYLQIKQIDKEHIPPLTKESEKLREPGKDYVPEQETEPDVPFYQKKQEFQPGSKRKIQNIEESIQKDELSTAQRT